MSDEKKIENVEVKDSEKKSKMPKFIKKPVDFVKRHAGEFLCYGAAVIGGIATAAVVTIMNKDNADTDEYEIETVTEIDYDDGDEVDVIETEE